MAVIAALELDHLVAAGVSADQAEDGHAGFGAAVDEPNHLDAWDSVDDHLSEGVLQGAGCAEAGAFLDRFLKSADHLGMGVTADRRTPAPDVIDVLVPIHVPRVGTFDPVEDDRLTAHRLEGPHRGAHSTRHQALGSTENGLGVAGVQGGSCHGDGCQGADANRGTS